MNNLSEHLKSPQLRLTLLMAGVALFSLAGKLLRQMDDFSALALWTLGVVITLSVLRNRQAAAPKRQDFIAAWGALGAAFALTVFPGQISAIWPLLLGVCGAIIYFGGLKMAGYLLIPALLFLVLVPAQGYLYVLLSLPLSEICAAATVFLLRIIGIQAVFNHAVIMVGNDAIAVTSACSGIELLEAMLLLGYFIVMRGKRPLWLRIAHYGTLLPIILLCNTIRLTAVIWLYFKIGERAFVDPIHSIFGYAVVLCSILLLALITPLFQLSPTPEVKNEKP